jgi:UDP-glucuronate 4-epimerase
MQFIEILEEHLGRKARKHFLPMQAGDVPATYADVDDLMQDVGFKPATSLETGIGEFVRWYASYYQVPDMPAIGVSEGVERHVNERECA